MIELEEKVDTLQQTLQDFIKNVGIEFNKVYNMHLQLEYEMQEFKEEMREFKDEMREFKDEMREFKDEMGEFKDEMREFKNEMSEFKNEMSDFKNEMSDFKTETERDRKIMNKQWGELSNKMGTLVEDIIFPGLPRVIQEHFGVEVDDLMIRRKRKLPDSRNREFDAIAVAGGRIYLNSTKSTIRKAYIDDFIIEINEFRDFFPEYRDYPVIGLLASLYIDDGMVNYAEKQGFCVITLADSPIAVLNTPGFIPKEW